MNFRATLSALVATFVVLGSTLSANAAEPRKYAVLSLIGDSMTIVTYATSVGSRLDRNQRESVSLPDPVFDRIASAAVKDALTRIDARNSVTLLSTPSRELFADQRKLFDGSRVVLSDGLVASLKNSGATHLLMLTKHRSATRVIDVEGAIGSGSLEGLGFYVEWENSTSRHDRPDKPVGLLAPFVYVRCSLIDLATSAVVREEIVTAAPASRSQAGNAWNVMTAGQKVELLSRTMVGEIDRVIPKLVGVS